MAANDDRAAIDRYRYLLRTAPPETVEAVHAEAFARLSPVQRQQVLMQLSSDLPPIERPASNDPGALARAATRAEYRSPGFLERTFGPRNGTGLANPLFGSVVGFVVGSALVGAILYPGLGYDAGYQDGLTDAGAGGADPGASPWGDTGSGWGGDGSAADFGGGGDFGF